MSGRPFDDLASTFSARPERGCFGGPVRRERFG